MTRNCLSRLVLLVVVFVSLISSSAFAYVLPDSGQTLCYDQTDTTVPISNITCPAPGSSNAQDGSYALHPMSLADNLDGTITDSNTGLMWQKNDSGATQYTWDQAVAACTAARTGNHADWRLPTKQELMSIIDYSVPPVGTLAASINATFFPNTQRDWYWTSTPLATDQTGTNAWYINFDGGKSGATPKSTVNPIRCVRGTSPDRPVLVNHNNGTATDTATGLMWMTGETNQVLATNQGNWAYALSFCETLDLAGFADWRLPDVKELASLADPTLQFAVSTAVFPNVRNFFYWTSTSDSRTPQNVFDMAASSGFVNNITLKTVSTGYTRCVRDGQTGAGSVLTITSPVSGAVVASYPPGINCGATCSAVYPVNTVVSLSVIPDPGDSTNGWPFLTGLSQGSDPDCSDGVLTMDTSKTCGVDIQICSGSMVYLISNQTATDKTSIVQAYGDSIVPGDIIALIAVHLQEAPADIHFNLGKDITLLGGVDCTSTSFNPAPYPYTFISGSITISSGSVSSGSVTFENIVIM